jgi:PAS domain S-box-containing protein
MMLNAHNDYRNRALAGVRITVQALNRDLTRTALMGARAAARATLLMTAGTPRCAPKADVKFLKQVASTFSHQFDGNPSERQALARAVLPIVGRLVQSSSVTRQTSRKKSRIQGQSSGHSTDMPPTSRSRRTPEHFHLSASESTRTAHDPQEIRVCTSAFINKLFSVVLDELKNQGAELKKAKAALVRANKSLEEAKRAHDPAKGDLPLQESEAHVRSVLASATEYAIFTLNLDGHVVTWNPGAQRILGYEPDAILGQPGSVMFTSEDRANGMPEQEMRRAAELGRASNDRWHLRADGSRFWATGMLMTVLDDRGSPQGFLNILRDHTNRHREEERRSLLLRELDHRIKNTLATVQSLVAQTLRHAPTLDDFRGAFDARLTALARSHALLSSGGWQGVKLQEVVERTLEAYAVGGAGRVSVAGPPILLKPSTAVTLNLALHELATNAGKYGALSVPDGCVEVIWTVDELDDHEVPLIRITWRERGGPPVQAPQRRGFGSRLLEQALPHEFAGEVVLDFAPEGVECRLSLPLGEAEEDTL